MDDADTQLVIAVAGTGKTITLVGKVKHLVREGIDFRGILLISLTNNTVPTSAGRWRLSPGACSAVTL